MFDFKVFKGTEKKALFLWSNSDGLQLLLLTSYPVFFEFSLFPSIVFKFCHAFSIRLSLHLESHAVRALTRTLVLESVFVANSVITKLFIRSLDITYFCRCNQNLPVNRKLLKNEVFGPFLSLTWCQKTDKAWGVFCLSSHRQQSQDQLAQKGNPQLHTNRV